MCSKTTASCSPATFERANDALPGRELVVGRYGVATGRVTTSGCQSSTNSGLGSRVERGTQILRSAVNRHRRLGSAPPGLAPGLASGDDLGSPRTIRTLPGPPDTTDGAHSALGRRPCTAYWRALQPSKLAVARVSCFPTSSAAPVRVGSRLPRRSSCRRSRSAGRRRHRATGAARAPRGPTRPT
jgi:hypothetical protein